MNSLKYFLYDWGGHNNSISQCIHSSTTAKPLLIFFKSIGQLGNFYLFPIHLILLLLIFFVILRSDQKNAMQRGVSHARCLSLLILNVLVGAIVFKMMKTGFSYPRPYCTLDFNMKQYLLHVFTYTQKACNASFPSGHTAYICLFIMSFWAILNRNFKIIGALLMVLVGLSRVILGQHFIADATYSYFIALIMLIPINNLLVAKYFPKYQPSIKKFLKRIF